MLLNYINIIRAFNKITELNLTKHSLIVYMFHTVPHASRKRTHQDVKVKEEGDPGGGLMLGHGGDDWNMDLGVPRVP